MQLQMIAPLDIGMEQQDAALGTGQEDFFDLGRTENGLRESSSARFLTDDNGDLIVESDDEEEDEQDRDADVMEDEREEKLRNLEVELDGMYDAYQGRLRERDAKFKVNESRRKNTEREEWNGIQEETSDGSESEEGGWDGMQDAKFNDSSSSSGHSDSEDPPSAAGLKRKRSENVVTNSKRPRLITDLKQPTSGKTSNTTTQIWFSQDVFTGLEDLNGLSDSDGTDDAENDDTSDDSEDEDSASTSTYEVVAVEDEDESEVWNIENEEQNNNLQAKNRSNYFMFHNQLSINFLSEQFGLDTPEAVTIAQQLVNREKTKTQLINEGFNRYSLNSKEGLPSWFLDDEAKFYKPNLPVTKEAMAALRARERALDARPIKKVAEAKARKKFKAAQRLEKAMKKAEGVNATSDMSEREKAQQIEKLMRKGSSTAKKAKKDIKVVVAKGAHKGLKGRPKGVKGRYTMVDARMKKEVRPLNHFFFVVNLTIT